MSKRLPARLEASYWPLHVSGGSWWLTDTDAPTPRRTFKRFLTDTLRSAWLAANGYRLTAIEHYPWSGETLYFTRSTP